MFDQLHRLVFTVVPEYVIAIDLRLVAAGILITRVAGNGANGANGESHLAGQITRQILAQPLALLASAGILLGFLLVPGFPKWPFLLMALGVGGVALWALR